MLSPIANEGSPPDQGSILEVCQHLLINFDTLTLNFLNRKITNFDSSQWQIHKGENTT